MPTIGALGTEDMGCVPCLLKSLIIGYWGDTLLEDTRTGEPDSLPQGHEYWHRLHQLARRWNYKDPDDLPAILEGKRESEKQKLTHDARAENMDRQQGADEIVRNILDGVEYTYPHQ
jgi:hypothetical protein